MRSWLVSLLLAAPGCGTHEPPRPGDVGTWRVVAAEPAAGVVVPAGLTGGIAPVVVDIDGPTGYVRATVTVERAAPDPNRRGELYDVLFPTSGRLRLVAEVEPASGDAGRTRVRFRSDSGAETSSSIVEPAVPLGHTSESTRATTEGLIAAGTTLPGGREVEVGRWALPATMGATRVTIRVLPARTPTGPRLKGEGRPPV